MSGRPSSCVAHHNTGAAISATRTAAAVSTRRRLPKSHRNGAAMYRSVGKLRPAVDVDVIGIIPLKPGPHPPCDRSPSVMPPPRLVNDISKRHDRASSLDRAPVLLDPKRGVTLGRILVVR